MDSLTLKRFALFFGGCLVVRVGMAIVAKVVPIKYLPLLGALAIIPAFRFIYIYVTGSNPRGAIFKDKAWWNDLRPLHGAMYGLFAVLALMSYRHAWLVLLADAFIGAVVFVLHFTTSKL
jgi:hypothetical protein